MGDRMMGDTERVQMPFTHNKGGKYLVEGTCIIEADLTLGVAYRSLDGPPKFPKGTLWVRPAEGFLLRFKPESRASELFMLQLKEKLDESD
jgi:hypothetical protein